MQINSIFNIPDDLVFDTLTFTVHGEDYGMGRPMKFSYNNETGKYHVNFLGYSQTGNTIAETYMKFKQTHGFDLDLP